VASTSAKTQAERRSAPAALSSGPAWAPWCDACTWAWHRDRMETKYVSKRCPEHGMLER